MSVEKTRRFEDLIRHGVEFVSTNGDRYVITNYPEEEGINKVEFETPTIECAGRQSKDRSIIEDWLQFGYWRERTLFDDEANR